MVSPPSVAYGDSSRQREQAPLTQHNKGRGSCDPSPFISELPNGIRSVSQTHFLDISV